MLTVFMYIGEKNHEQRSWQLHEKTIGGVKDERFDKQPQISEMISLVCGEVDNDYDDSDDSDNDDDNDKNWYCGHTWFLNIVH